MRGKSKKNLIIIDSLKLFRYIYEALWTRRRVSSTYVQTHQKYFQTLETFLLLHKKIRSEIILLAEENYPRNRLQASQINKQYWLRLVLVLVKSYIRIRLDKDIFSMKEILHDLFMIAIFLYYFSSCALTLEFRETDQLS